MFYDASSGARGTAPVNTEHSMGGHLRVKQNSHSRTGPEILGIVAMVNIAASVRYSATSDAEGRFSLDLMMWG